MKSLVRIAQEAKKPNSAEYKQAVTEFIDKMGVEDVLAIIREVKFNRGLYPPSTRGGIIYKSTSAPKTEKENPATLSM